MWPFKKKTDLEQARDARNTFQYLLEEQQEKLLEAQRLVEREEELVNGYEQRVRVADEWIRKLLANGSR